MNNIAVSLNNIYKVYKLYKRHNERLKEAFHPKGKKYHRLFYALRNVSLDIRKGEVLGIIGVNGAGKSTMINIITGILTPSSGSVKTHGRISPVLGLGTGFDPDRSGIENIYLHGMIMGFPREEMDKKLNGIIEFAEIGKFIEQPLKTYSAGMKARLGFAVASNVEPDILVLDEVIAVGDALFQRKCFARMEDFFKKGCTVLFVSHNSNAIAEICTRVILLDRGELILDGDPKFVTTQYLKFLYTKHEEQEKVRQELINMNQAKIGKNKSSENVSIVKKSAENIQKDGIETSKNIEKKQRAQYLPSFQSKSKIIQKLEDVDIVDVIITTLNGEKVNHLINKDDYYLIYKVKFNVEIMNCFFNWVVKEARGRRLAGSRYPKKKAPLIHALKGQLYELKWKFNCSFYSGNYYIDLGVARMTDYEVKGVVRALDSIVFKVQKQESNEKNFSQWGIFDIDQMIEDIIISD